MLLQGRAAHIEVMATSMRTVGSALALPSSSGPSVSSLLSTAFKAPEFIAYVGTLTERLVIDYFAQSPFYDRQCTNQVLRMQNIAAGGDPLGRWAPHEEEEQLKAFEGTEYVVVAGPGLPPFGAAAKTEMVEAGTTSSAGSPNKVFVIHRRERTSPTETIVTGAYYVLNDTIMQAPDLQTILGNRLVRLMYTLRTCCLLTLCCSSRRSLLCAARCRWRGKRSRRSTCGPLPRAGAHGRYTRSQKRSKKAATQRRKEPSKASVQGKG